jgi:hypothetical protein
VCSWFLAVAQQQYVKVTATHHTSHMFWHLTKIIQILSTHLVILVYFKEFMGALSFKRERKLKQEAIKYKRTKHGP